LYLPAATPKPVPLRLIISFTANTLPVDEPGVKVGAVWNPREKQELETGMSPLLPHLSPAAASVTGISRIAHPPVKPARGSEAYPSPSRDVFLAPHANGFGLP
jgi:hypothetical protein